MAARPDDTGDAPDRGDPPDDEVAERWAEIVADLGPLGAGDEPDRTADPDPGVGPAVTYPVAPWVAARPAARELSGRDWAGTDDIDAAEAEIDEREHFVPPDPGPVLGGDPLLTMAWLGAAGVPIGLILVLVVWRDAPAVLMQAAGVVFVLSCALLVWRMPHRPEDDDRGPGAVV
jgi:hypothetical protein